MLAHQQYHPRGKEVDQTREIRFGGGQPWTAPLLSILDMQKEPEEDPSHPKHILSIRGAGYQFVIFS